jgi:hypothetical protein
MGVSRMRTRRRFGAIALTIVASLLLADTAVAGGTNTRLTLKAPDRVHRGDTVTFTGELNSGLDACEEGQTILLYRVRAGRMILVSTTATNRRGEFEFKVEAERTATYKALFEGTNACEHATSDPERVRVKRRRHRDRED